MPKETWEQNTYARWLLNIGIARGMRSEEGSALSSPQGAHE